MCSAHDATISLGQLLSTHGGAVSGTATIAGAESINLPVVATPGSFPSDAYGLKMVPRVDLPEIVYLETNEAQAFFVPFTLRLETGPEFDDRDVRASIDRPDKLLVMPVVITRPLADQLLVYLVIILPALIAGLIFSLARPLSRPHGQADPVSVAGLFAALLAALLTILPLRAVLVPPELSSAGLTFADRLLLLVVMFIAGLVCWLYGRVARPEGRGGHL